MRIVVGVLPIIRESSSIKIIRGKVPLVTDDVGI